MTRLPLAFAAVAALSLAAVVPAFADTATAHDASKMLRQKSSARETQGKASMQAKPMMHQKRMTHRSM